MIMEDNAKASGLTELPMYHGAPGYAKPFAEAIESPVFLGWGEVDVSADPHGEPSAYPRSGHVTLSVVEQMAHMHNFADTRQRLWEDLLAWLPVARRHAHAP